MAHITMGLKNSQEVTLGLAIVLLSSYYIYDRVARYNYMSDVFIAVIILVGGIIYLYSHLDN